MGNVYRDFVHSCTLNPTIDANHGVASSFATSTVEVVLNGSQQHRRLFCDGGQGRAAGAQDSAGESIGEAIRARTWQLFNICLFG